jgi:DNA-binding PucR family transcriptional regulator
VPRTAAVLACAEEDLDRIARLLPPDTLATTIDGVGCAVIPDPDGPGRPAEVSRAVGERRAALGPTAELPASWALARQALLAAQAGTGLLRVDEHLIDLLLAEGRPLLERLTARRLAPLDELGPGARSRMADTAYAYVREGGNAAAMARTLDLHPQTVRYRLARLRELLGEQLEDPDARLELELALRYERYRELT